LDAARRDSHRFRNSLRSSAVLSDPDHRDRPQRREERPDLRHDAGRHATSSSTFTVTK
jgi:hypothetical protein